MKITVRDGVADFRDIQPLLYVGWTGDKKNKTRIEYQSFSIAPKPGDTGVIVFKDMALKQHLFYQYSWKGEKLIVTRGISHKVNLFAEGCGDNSFGLMVEAGPYRYVTRVPEHVEGAYRLVEVLELVRYIEGRISLAQLHRHAGQVIRRIPYERRLANSELILRDNAILVARNLELLKEVDGERVAKEKLRKDLKTRDVFIREGMRALNVALTDLDEADTKSTVAVRLKSLIQQGERRIAGF